MKAYEKLGKGRTVFCPSPREGAFSKFKQYPSSDISLERLVTSYSCYAPLLFFPPVYPHIVGHFFKFCWHPSYDIPLKKPVAT